MNNNLSVIALILDRSGSMGSIRPATINNVNKFVKTQKAVPGEAHFYFCQFNTEVDVPDPVDLKRFDDLGFADYVPNGGTALLDAVGETIDKIGKRLSETAEDERPSKVIIAILTDGKENASQKYNRETIAATIQHQQEVYKWEFLFLGANIDSFAEAGALNIPHANTMNFDHSVYGVHRAESFLTENVTRMRTGG